MQPERAMRGLAAVIRRRDAADELRHSPRSFLEAAGVQGPDLDQLSGLGADRLLVYRRLVFNRFVDAVQMSIPRAINRRGEAAFRQDVARFLDDQGSGSPYLRDIASEFVRWVEPLWKSDAEVPDYLPDLARHELLSFETASVQTESSRAVDEELDLQRPVVFEGSARVERYAYAVHRLPEDESDRSEPDREPTALLAYRDTDHKVRYLDLGPVAASVVEHLLDGTELRTAVEKGCADAGAAVDDELLGGIAQLLADLAERGVILGAGKS